ncbi:gap junction alpha-8 protein-like [Hemibagrus wyckioides]|uniref:gap junction alpha-8 protein-like n=1 Tax=Hemibagrus wyckioides TaxID=337641 RepID=UPI00266D47E0|nr:gap junction alpha-8 protein-like [Hemibagrus wyckioides]
MSIGEWTFLEKLVDDSLEYSTSVGRVWLSVLFLFRVLILCTAAESAWNDEQKDFVCNTQQPGCEAMCYDKAFPVSHFRYFILQVVFVSMPTVLYFGYVALKKHKEKEEEKEDQHGRQKERNGKECKIEMMPEENKDGKPRPKTNKLTGKVLVAYTVSIILKVLIEIGFIVGLWFLYGFVIQPKYECQRSPCPHTVDCFVSRPTEKTIFTIYIQVIAAVSVLLNVIELLHLLKMHITCNLEEKNQSQQQGIPRSTENTPEKPQSAKVRARTCQEKGKL